MQNLEIENNNNQLILKINKEGLDESYLINLVKKIQTELIAQESKISDDILKVANKIDSEWWKKNGDDFLKGIKK